MLVEECLLDLSAGDFHVVVNNGVYACRVSYLLVALNAASSLDELLGLEDGFV